MKGEEASSSIGSNDDMNALVGELVYHVERMPPTTTPNDDDNSSGSSAVITRNCVMKLKSLHNNLRSNLSNLQIELNEISRKQKVEQLALDALTYERHHLQYEIDTSSKYKTPKLKLLAKQINNNCNNTSKDSDAKDGPNNTLFDGNINMNDPANRSKMIQRLHEEMNIRASLEQKLKNSKRELKQLSDELNVKRRFINTLPEQLSTVERASLPIQKLVQRYNTASTTSATANAQQLLSLSSERYERMQCAKKLPAPLYTLYRQIQYYLDNCGNASNKMTVSVTNGGIGDTTTTTTQDVVLLTVPVPDIKTEQSIAAAAAAASTTTTSTTTAKQKRISLHFKQQQFGGGAGDGGDTEEHEPSPQPPPPSSQVVVTVSVTNGSGTGATGGGGTNLLFADTLFDELFPNDIGLTVVSQQQQQQQQQGQSLRRQQQQQSYYYHWANYMAGLSLSTATVSTQDVEGMNNTSRDDSSSNSPPRPLLCHSTRVIMHEINRRIRSNATLKYILQQLQQHRKLPSLPHPVVGVAATTAEEQEESALLLSQCQIQSCVAERSESKSIDDTTYSQPKLEQSYVITLRNKTTTGAGSSPSASSWKIKVKVNLARYPAVPPVWTLIDSSNGSDLYDSKLEKIQRYVNEGLLLKQQQKLQQHQGDDGENSNSNNNKDTNDFDLFADWILVQQLRSIICKWLSNNDDDDDDEDYDDNDGDNDDQSASNKMEVEQEADKAGEEEEEKQPPPATTSSTRSSKRKRKA